MSSEAINQRFVYVPKPALVASLILHAALPVAFLLMVGLEKLGIDLFPGKKRISTTDVYQNYIQVDMVALPDELMNERSSIDPTLPIVQRPEEAVDPVPENKAEEEAMKLQEEAAKQEMELATAAKKKAEEEKKKQEAEEKAKLKADKQKALEKLKQEAEKEAALKALAAKDGRKGRTALKGNLLSKGTAMSGMIGTAKDRYTALVAQKVRENFNIFAWQKKKGLSAVVYIEILPNGRLKEKKLIKASKDPVYDAAVLQAVEAAQPLPIPEDMSLVSDGINLEFKPET